MSKEVQRTIVIDSSRVMDKRIRDIESDKESKTDRDSRSRSNRDRKVKKNT